MAGQRERGAQCNSPALQLREKLLHRMQMCSRHLGPKWRLHQMRSNSIFEWKCKKINVTIFNYRAP